MRWLTKTRVRGTSTAFLLVCGVAALDYITGREMSFSFFYVAPVLLATWAGGSLSGILFSVVSGLAFVYTDALAGIRYSSGWIPFWNFAVRGAILMTIALLASMVKDRLEYERSLARIDPLTGIPNARAFRDRLALECARSARMGAPLSIAYLDLDGFKGINDRHGHELGDEVLARVGQALREGVRSVDMVGRLGGDEFAVLLGGSAEEGAGSAVQRLRTKIADLHLEKMGADCSVGLATLHYPDPTPHEAIWLADRLMYEAKRDGRGGMKARTFRTRPSGDRDEAEGFAAASS